jgi:hypothetical protein
MAHRAREIGGAGIEVEADRDLNGLDGGVCVRHT